MTHRPAPARRGDHATTSAEPLGLPVDGGRGGRPRPRLRADGDRDRGDHAQPGARPARGGDWSAGAAAPASTRRRSPAGSAASAVVIPAVSAALSAAGALLTDLHARRRSGPGSSSTRAFDRGRRQRDARRAVARLPTPSRAGAGATASPRHDDRLLGRGALSATRCGRSRCRCRCERFDARRTTSPRSSEAFHRAPRGAVRRRRPRARRSRSSPGGRTSAAAARRRPTWRCAAPAAAPRAAAHAARPTSAATATGRDRRSHRVRARCRPARRVAGPAIVESPVTTVVVPPGAALAARLAARCCCDRAPPPRAWTGAARANATRRMTDRRARASTALQPRADQQPPRGDRRAR